MVSIDSRRDLMYALSEAAAIEHSLLCQYLFAGYSIRRSPAADLPGARLKNLQDWAGTILLVAREEMEHLGTVCNLLASIGAAPNFRRPNFPQPARYFGDVAAFSLERFSLDTMRRFAEFEKPEFLHLRETIIRRIESYGGGPRDDLDVVLEAAGVDGLWDYGEAWIVKDEGLDFATAWDGRPSSEPQAAAWRQESQHGSPGREVMARLAEEARATNTWVSAAVAPPAAGLNTAAALPIIIEGRVLAVVAFLYRTYLDAHEDDAYVEIVFDALNEGSYESDRLARLLRRHDGIKPKAPRLSTDGHGLMPGRFEFSTIGGFYRQIRKGFLALGTDPSVELFIGPVDAQITSKEIGLPFAGWHNVDPGRVANLASALEAIDQIIIEGEGSPRHSETSHYSRFVAIVDDLRSVLTVDPAFEPAAAVASNPVVRLHSDTHPKVLLFRLEPGLSASLDGAMLPETLIEAFLTRAHITLAVDARVDVVEPGMSWRITDPRGRHVFACRRTPNHVSVYQTVTRLETEVAVSLADLFNASYEVMLLMLIRLYAHTDDSAADLKELAGVAFLPLMTQVLRPLTEVLMEEPATPVHPELRAGPTFEVYNDLHMLPHRSSARAIFRERMQSIAEEAGRLAGLADSSPRLALLHRNATRIADRLGEPAKAERPS